MIHSGSLPVVAALLTGFIAVAAHAQITARWEQVPITPAAVASDPALSGMQTWDLIVTTTGNWASAGIVAFLPESSAFYNPSQGGWTRPSPATVEAFPHVAFDTYVSSPADTGTAGAPSLLGGMIDAYPMSLGGSGTAYPRVVNIAWGDLRLDGPGTYPIARWTFPLGVFPNVINGDDTQSGNGSRTSQVSPDSTTEIPDIPEPAAAFVLPAAMLLGRCRRIQPCDTSHARASR